MSTIQCFSKSAKLSAKVKYSSRCLNYTKRLARNVSILSPFFRRCFEGFIALLDGMGSSDREQGGGYALK